MIEKVGNTRNGKEYKIRNAYDSLYVSLSYIANKSESIPKSVFSNSKTIQNLGINNGLICEDDTDADTMSGKRDPRTKYYKITQKGLKYLQLYRNLNEVVQY